MGITLTVKEMVPSNSMSSKDLSLYFDMIFSHEWSRTSPYSPFPTLQRSVSIYCDEVMFHAPYVFFSGFDTVLLKLKAYNLFKT